MPSIFSVPKEQEDLFRVFWNSGFHSNEELWPGETRAVLVIYGKNSTEIRTFRNEPNGQHAEEFIIQHLATLRVLEDYKLKLFINYSPCECCSILLRGFLSAHPNIQIRYYFSSLYGINRTSCKAHDHSMLPRYVSSDTEANLAALTTACKGTMKMKTFDQSVWTDFTETITFMTSPPIVSYEKFYHNRRVELGRTREQEDEKMAEDFKLVMNAHKKIF